MKIAIISTMAEVSWGGSEELWGQMAQKALADNHHVLALLPRWRPRSHKVQHLERLGLHVEEWKQKGSSRKTNADAGLPEWYPYNPLENFVPDVVCVSHGGLLDVVNGHFLLVEYLLTRAIPYVVVIQANTELYQPNNEQRAVLNAYFKAARKVLFVSQANLDVARRQLAAPIANGAVINNPVNLQGQKDVAWPTEKTPQLACVARLETTSKAQDVLFEVLAQKKWLERDWNLSLFGKGQHEAYLRDLAAHYQLSNRLRWRFINDVRYIWQHHHLLVLPSRIEGTPLVLMEAMLCGRPSVVADAGGNFEWVRNGQEGFRAQSSSPRHIDEALEAAWACREQWPQLGQNARDFFLKHHDPSPANTLLSCLIRATLPSAQNKPAGQQKPLISVIVPCYNQAHWLPETIESILAQTYTNWECIIVNDGSTDNTSEVAHELIAKKPNVKISLLEKENGGVAQARNVGIQKAKGEWILLLDSDDIIHKDYLAKAVQQINTTDTINFINYGIQEFGEKKRQHFPVQYIRENLLRNNAFTIASVFKKELWKKAGGLFEALPWQVEDWNFWIDLSQYGLRPINVNETIFYYRVRTGSGFDQVKPLFHEAHATIITLHPDLYREDELESAIKILCNMSDQTLQRVVTASKKHPDSSMPHFWLGLRKEAQNKKFAIKEYEKALSIHDKYRDNIAYMLKKFGLYEQREDTQLP